MQSDKAVLVVVDPTQGPAQCAVTRGVWLAKKLDVRLNLVVSQYRQYPTALGLVDPDMMEAGRLYQGRHYQSYLEQLAQSIAADIPDIELTTLIDTHMTEAVLGHAVATNALMIVKQAHHHALLDRTLLTNSDWEFVRDCPLPLWLAKADDWHANATILASIDPTKGIDDHANLDNVILDAAAMLASALAAPLHVFHSFMPMPLYAHALAEPNLWSPADVDAVQLAAHSDRVDELLTGRNIEARYVHVQPGVATRLLPDCATEVKAGVVVMGSIARSRLKRVFVGSTVEEVLEKIACDVVVVKPESFVCPIEARPPSDFAWRDPESLPENVATDSHPPVWIP